MCNFHEAVARKAAMDTSGNIHPGHKAVIRVALSRYWAERYVEGGESVTGYNPYPLATRQQQDAFARSGLKRPISEIAREEEESIAYIRARIADLEQELDLSASALRLPLSTARESFIDLAIASFYTGDPKGEFKIVDTVDRDDLKPLHRAVSALHGDERTRQALERLVRGQIGILYSEAPRLVNRKLLDTYENLPNQAKKMASAVSRYGGNILLGGFSGLVGHGIHYGSVLGAGIASGTASSANIMLSGAFLLASYGGWHSFFGGQYQNTKQQLGAFAVQASLTFAIAAGAQYVTGHDHMSNERAAWYESLPEQYKDEMTRASRENYETLPGVLKGKLDLKAAQEGLPPEIYLLICGGDDPLSRDIAVYLESKKNVQPSALSMK